MPSFPNCLQCGKSNKGGCTCLQGFETRVNQLKGDLRAMEDYALALKHSESELLDVVATQRALIAQLEGQLSMCQACDGRGKLP